MWKLPRLPVPEQILSRLGDAQGGPGCDIGGSLHHARSRFLTATFALAVFIPPLALGVDRFVANSHRDRAIFWIQPAGSTEITDLIDIAPDAFRISSTPLLRRMTMGFSADVSAGGQTEFFRRVPVP